MLRYPLFVAAALFSAGVVSAQVTDDPQAAAPVVYSNAPAAEADCGGDLRNADGSPAVRCDAQQGGEEETPGDTYADAPVYEAPEYYAGDYYGAWPAYDYAPYWNYGWGWPYYAYSPFGYGPYFSVGFSWYGGRWRGGWDHDHYYNGHGWRDHGGHGWHGHDHGGYRGPYRYVGNGHYWNETHAMARANTGGAAGSRFGTATNSASRGYATRNPGSTAQFSGTRFNVPQRGALPSSSYYANSRGGAAYDRGSRPVTSGGIPMNHAASVSGATRNVGARDPHWVASLPSRGYAPATSSNRSANNARAYGYTSAHGYAAGARMPQGAYAAHGYGMQQRAVPAYRGGGYAGQHAGMSAPRMSGGTAHYAAGGSHSSGGGHSSSTGGGHSSGHSR